MNTKIFSSYKTHAPYLLSDGIVIALLVLNKSIDQLKKAGRVMQQVRVQSKADGQRAKHHIVDQGRSQIGHCPWREVATLLVDVARDQKVYRYFGQKLLEQKIYKSYWRVTNYSIGVPLFEWVEDKSINMQSIDPLKF